MCEQYCELVELHVAKFIALGDGPGDDVYREIVVVHHFLNSVGPLQWVHPSRQAVHGETYYISATRCTYLV